MPIYEYRCAVCHRRFSVFFRSFSDVREPECAHCGASDAARLPSRVGIVQSEDSRLERLADPSALGEVDESDPGSVARWAKRMGREMGEDVGPEFDEAIDSIAPGEDAGAAEESVSDDLDG